MLRSRKQRDLKRVRLTPTGLLLSFLVRIQTADPLAFEMPRQTKPDFFIFEGGFAFSLEECVSFVADLEYLNLCS